MRPVVVAQARTPFVDPHDCTDAADALTIIGAVHAALVRRTGPGRFAPDLAEGWSVSADARVWTFRLRPGLRFHDRSPVDAEAAAASLRRMARPDVGATLGAPAVWAQYLGGADIAALSARDLCVALDAPMADLLDVVSCGHVLAPDALDDPVARPIGAGPYSVVAHGPDAVRVEAAPQGGSPPNPTLEWRRIADRDDRLAALASGVADAATDLPDRARLAGATIATCFSPTLIVYLFNVDRPAVADLRVRRALNLAIDRAALADAALGGAAEPLRGVFAPAHLGWRPGAPAFDATAARRLLREAGAGDGLRLEVDIPTTLPDEAEPLTAALAAQLSAVGVELAVRRWPDREAYAHRVRRSEVGDLCLFDSSPLSSWRVLREKIDSRVRGSWWLGYRNATVEALIDRARVELDAERRAALYAACHDAMLDDPPWLTIHRHRRTVGLRGRHPGWTLGDDAALDVLALPAFGLSGAGGG